MKLEIRHRTLRTEDSYHKHANNNKKQTLSWSWFVARVVHLTFLDDSDSKSPNEGRHRLKLIERVYSSATFDITISATKSAPSKRSSRLQPICIRHLNTAAGTNFWILKQRTCNADHLTGQFPIESSSRFIVVHLCFILQGCKNVPPDVLLPHMSLVMFRGFISSGTIYTSEYLPARCWGLERLCVVGKSGDFTYKDSAVWIDDAWCVFGVFQFQGRQPFICFVQITWGFRRRRAWHGLIPLAAAWREPKPRKHGRRRDCWWLMATTCQSIHWYLPCNPHGSKVVACFCSTRLAIKILHGCQDLFAFRFPSAYVMPYCNTWCPMAWSACSWKIVCTVSIETIMALFAAMWGKERLMW